MEASGGRSSKSAAKTTSTEDAMQAELERGFRGFSPHTEAGRDDTIEADDDKRSGAFGEADAVRAAVEKAEAQVQAAS